MVTGPDWGAVDLAGSVRPGRHARAHQQFLLPSLHTQLEGPEADALSHVQDGVNIGVGGTNRGGGPRALIVQGLQAGLKFTVAGVAACGRLVQGAELPVLLLLVAAPHVLEPF